MMKKPIFFFLLIFIVNIAVVFSASCSFAEDPAEKEKSQEVQEVYNLDTPAVQQIPTFDVKKYSIRMVISLTIVIGLAFLAVLILRKFYSTSIPAGKGKGLMRIVERFPLGPKSHLLLLWVIDRMVLVSVQNGTVQKICEIKDRALAGDIGQDVFEDSLNREMAEENTEEVSHV